MDVLIFAASFEISFSFCLCWFLSFLLLHSFPLLFHSCSSLRWPVSFVFLLSFSSDTQIVRGLSYFDSFYSRIVTSFSYFRKIHSSFAFLILTAFPVCWHKSSSPFHSIHYQYLFSCLSSLSLLYFLSVAHPHNRCIATWIFCHAIHIFYISLYEFANSFPFSYDFPKKISD